jgi:CheY-like chemotaxis protein
VVLMSGVVNKTVADKAVSVHADELIRKPFQPQELIHRVKSLLGPKNAEVAEAEKVAAPSLNLNQLFAPAAVAPRMIPSAALVQPAPGPSPWPRALAEAFAPVIASGLQPAEPQAAASLLPASVAGSFAGQQQHPHGARPAGASPDLQKLRAEITWLDSLVKKLQAELQNERQYNQSLENQIRALTHGE